jgi:hypothetical protein
MTLKNFDFVVYHDTNEEVNLLEYIDIDHYDSDIDNEEEMINEEYYFKSKIILHSKDLFKVEIFDINKFYIDNPYPLNPGYDELTDRLKFSNGQMKNAQLENAFEYDLEFKKDYYSSKRNDYGFGRGKKGYIKWLKYKYMRQYNVDLDVDKFISRCPIYKKQLKKMIFSGGNADYI